LLSIATHSCSALHTQAMKRYNKPAPCSTHRVQPGCKRSPHMHALAGLTLTSWNTMGSTTFGTGRWMYLMARSSPLFTSRHSHVSPDPPSPSSRSTCISKRLWVSNHVAFANVPDSAQLGHSHKVKRLPVPHAPANIVGMLCAPCRLSQPQSLGAGAPPSR
jgi:hypothetical protein